MSLFEKASRVKLRFPSDRGSLSVEDLWEMPLTGAFSLDTVGREVRSKLSDNNTESLVPGAESAKAKSVRETLELSFDIIKHIINVRLAEREAKLAEKERADTKRKIQTILAERKDNELSNKSDAELQELLKTL